MFKQIERGQESNKNGNKPNNHVHFFLKKIQLVFLKKMTLYKQWGWYPGRKKINLKFLVF